MVEIKEDDLSGLPWKAYFADSFVVAKFCNICGSHLIIKKEITKVFLVCSRYGENHSTLAWSAKLDFNHYYKLLGYLDQDALGEFDIMTGERRAQA